MHANQQQQICFENGNKYHVLQSLGESKKGCNTFKARTNHGNDVLITKWSFDVEEVCKKCPISCEDLYKTCSRDHNDAAVFIRAFKQRATYLIHNIDHTNLVRYIDVSCTEFEGKLTIHLVQEYIDGAKSIRCLSEEGVLPDLAPIAEWMIKVISYLEKMNPKITHGYINDGSIFLDKSGVYRVSDFNLIKYLMYLKGTIKINEINDLKALGSFINIKNKTVQHFSKDFVRMCCLNEKPSCRELLSHEFLSNVHIGDATTTYNGPLLNQFEVKGILGRGAYGSVVKAKQPVNQELYALKIIRIPIGSKGNYTKVKREVDLISHVNHKNVVKYLNSWEQTIDANELGIYFHDELSDSGSSSSAPASKEDAKVLTSKYVDVIIIQMELCNMDLRKAIKEGQAQNKSTRLRLFEEILHGLAYLHDADIIHRDLKPENILLDAHGHAKIGDFGLAITVNLVMEQRSKKNCRGGATNARSSQTGLVGTSYYVAPELTEKASLSEYGKEADIYSLGVIFFEMLHRPFETSMDRDKTLNDIRSKDIIFPNWMDSKGFYTEIVIIKKMLDHSPKSRPTATSLIDTDLNDEGLEEIADELSAFGDAESAYLSESDVECQNSDYIE